MVLLASFVYLLAAYAAVSQVLTAQPIEEINPEREILRERPPGEVGPVDVLIRSAVKIACDHLVPRDFDPDIWRHHLVAQNAKETQFGLNWLRTELPDDWNRRARIARILEYLSKRDRVTEMKRWRKDGHAAAILAGAVRNDHV